MKNKKLLLIIAAALVVVFSVTVTVVLIRGNNDLEKVTVTFETNNGNKVDPITVNKGDKLTKIPQSYLVGSTFNGWFTDEELKNAFSPDTAIVSDMKLYAGFTESDVDMELTETTQHLAEKVAPYHSVRIKSTTAYSAKEFLDKIKIEAVSGYLPWEVSESIVSGTVPKDIYGWFDVTVSDSVYTLTPKAIEFNGKTYYAYTEGKLYKITIPQDMQFADLSDSIVEYVFRINESVKDSVDNVKYKNEDELIYVKKSKIKNINDITKVTTENNMVGEATTVTEITKDSSGYYQFIFSETDYNRYGIEAEKILCIGEGEVLKTDSLFVKVVQSIKVDGQTVGSGEYLVVATDAEVGDVFDKIDINFEQEIGSDQIIAGLDTEEIENTIRTNGSFEKVTDLMTNLVYISDEVQSAYAADRLTQRVGYTLGLPDFCTNTRVENEKTLLKASLLKGADVRITVGDGHNPNFDKAYTDEFVALKITFTYEASIKDRLDINAELVFTQYLAVSAQGYLDYDVEFVVINWVDFDYALNIYSQTDIDFKILVRTVKPDGSKDSKFSDISEKIMEKLESEEGDDPDNLVAELQEMLKSENGYIELFRAPIIRIPIDIIPALPVMRVQVELDFLVEMNFAAGLSAHMSVLEAVQVGVTGDTRTKNMSSYKYDLPGGNQYALQLSACGYIGFRAGFKGGLSVSFCGLSDLGKVGVYVFVGPYVDIYGFAQATLVKQNTSVTQSLVGGYYIEVGMFLEITLECRSDLFGVKVGAVLYNQKWPLVKFGNKEVLVSIESSAIEETVYISNEGEDEASVSIANLPALKGTYLDITTGKTSVKDVPWDKISLRMSEYSFTYDYATKTINYRNLRSPKPVSESCIATYHYNGSILQFNMTSAQYQDYYPFARAKIVYYDSTKLNKSDAGKTVRVTFSSCINGEKTVMSEIYMETGGRLLDYPTLDPYKYTNIRWDRVPHQTVIDSDTEFICYADRTQTYIAFVYYDIEKDIWVTEIRACDVDATPVAPDVQSGGKVTFTGWRGYNGFNNRANNTPSSGIGKNITGGDMWKYGWFLPDTTTGYAPDQTVVKYVPDKNVTLFDELTDNTSPAGFMWYSVVASIYVAEYDYDDCTVTVYSTDAKGVEHKDDYTVGYGKSLTHQIYYSPISMEFIGYSLTKDGEIVYNTYLDIGAIKKDTVLYARYKKVVHDVNLYYWDGNANEYKLYKTYKVDGGDSIGHILDFETAKSKLVKENGTEYEFLYFVDDSGYLSQSSICASSMNVYPFYERTVKVTFTPGDGFFITDREKKEIAAYTETKLRYNVDIGIACARESNDPKYRYEFIGWKNKTTGEIISFEEAGRYTFTLNCSVPTTFEAVYRQVERTGFNVTIRTDHGTLKNGDTEIVLKNVDYDTYKRYVDEYTIWTPSDYRDDKNHCTYKYKGRDDYSSVSSGTFSISYNHWEKVVDKYTVTVDANGGDYYGDKTVEKEWNDKISLSNIYAYVGTKEDDSAIYEIDCFEDKAGNRYDVDAEYTVTADDTLKVIWKVKKYKEYKVTLVLDGVTIDTKTYHKDDALDFTTKPTQADGKVFSGWKWYGSNGKEIVSLSKMPAEDLKLVGTSYNVYIKYVVDGVEITEYRTVGRVGYAESVRDKYAKEGYTVSDWSVSGAAVGADGKFTMPENDVIFTATTAKNSYKLTYYYNGAVYGDPIDVLYGEYVLLAELPKQDGMYFAWTSDDVRLSSVGFTMPACDVAIRAVASETTQYVIYYVNDVIVGYEKAVPGQKISVKSAPQDEKYSGMSFSGWYVGDKAIGADGTYTVGNETVNIYGYFTSGATKVNIYFSEQSTSPDLVMYGNAGDKINITMLLGNKMLSGYKVNGSSVSEIVIPSTGAEINAYVEYTEKTYKVSYDIYGAGTLPEDAYYKPGSKVELAAYPELLYGYVPEGWFVAGATVTYENGKYYFIMPERDVVVNLKSSYVSSTEPATGYKTASVYINSPYGNAPIFYKSYIIDNDDGPVYFDVPVIEGYEFVCWRDENGNVAAYDNQGVKLSDMAGRDQSFYGEYRRLELHIIEFRVNNKVVGYQRFYDGYSVSVPSPEIELKSGESFSGWLNNFVRPYTRENVTFYTGERHTYEYAGMDFIFNGYVYTEEGSYSVNVIYPDKGGYDFMTNEGAEIKLDASCDGTEYMYTLVVHGYSESSSETPEMYVDTVKNGDEYVLTVPTSASVKAELGEEFEINYMDIIVTVVNSDQSADSI